MLNELYYQTLSAALKKILILKSTINSKNSNYIPDKNIEVRQYSTSKINA